jgi:serine/threonine protein kinase
MIRASVSPSLLLYKTQEWFFVHVAGLQVSKDERELNEDFVKQLNALLKEVVDHNRDVIDEYKQMVSESIQAVAFSQHKMYMEGLIANALELLSWLRYKGVAIRDIKPDNLLVAGDPDRYPAFLSSPTAFKIGLIDVETAVDIKPEDGKIIQPQLGGTPFYATPLNMFSNRTLLTVYGDLPRALFMQDWFATMAMIYGIIMNDYLFGRTAKQLVVMTRKIQKALKAKQPPEAIIKEANSIFWASAGEEFSENMEKNANRLRNIRVVLHDRVREMIARGFEQENKGADKAIRRLVLQQTLFKSQKNQEQLYLGSADRIGEIVDKIKNKPGIDAQSLAQLESIRQLKQRVRYYSEIIAGVRQDGLALSAYHLLDIMFNLVRDFMFSNLR